MDTRSSTAAQARRPPSAQAGQTSALHPALPRLQIRSAGNAAFANTWQPLGPTAVQTPDYGLVTGRVSAIALDPSDATGNRLYIGTTGGGVWVANNAGVSASASIVFAPLTDSVPALSGVNDASISIGALTVQPGETGVILAGTGDPNDVLDSYYGAGILRSTDGGNTWSVIQQTADVEQGLSAKNASFAGQGFAGFAWSTVNPQLVVAAVSQAYEGSLVGADWPLNTFDGLFYSTDSGATWHLATITDGVGQILQGPSTPLTSGGQRSHRVGLESGAAVVCGRGARTTAITSRQTALPGRAWPRSPAPGSPRRCVPPPLGRSVPSPVPSIAARWP